MNALYIFLIVVILLALILVKNSLVIIPQSETKIIERLGKYYATLKPGINLIIPFIDRAKSMDVTVPHQLSTCVNRYMTSTSRT
jgi:regulator of protease activity HflC (stomatin/prohibitin superfamily)